MSMSLGKKLSPTKALLKMQADGSESTASILHYLAQVCDKGKVHDVLVLMLYANIKSLKPHKTTDRSVL